jgi:hypothetical protein
LDETFGEKEKKEIFSYIPNDPNLGEKFSQPVNFLVFPTKKKKKMN